MGQTGVQRQAGDLGPVGCVAPNLDREREPVSFADVDARNSLYGEVSAFVAPVFAPAGFDDWHTSSALITG